MLTFSVILSLLAITVSGRHFFNPVMEGENLESPGVTKVNGVYYAVTETKSNSGYKFPISVSNDLQTWVQKGFVFPNKVLRSWTNAFFYSPEIHQIGNHFYCYFTAQDSKNKAISVGRAIADNILGPYSDLGSFERLSDPDIRSLYSTLIRSGNDLFLVWTNNVNQSTIWASRMGDGLEFSDDKQHALLHLDRPWEGRSLNEASHVEHGGFHYLFYTSGGAIGVARSSDPLGPYEKRPDPIVVSSIDFKTPRYCSVVKDINDFDDVMVYNTILDGSRVIMSQAIGWGADGWPFMA